MPDTPRVRPTLGDHLRVAWVLVCSVGALIPLGIFLLFSPILAPWMRARLRKRLQSPPEAPADPPPVDAQAWAGRTVFVVAGEPSGDRLAARIFERAQVLAPDLRVTGYGGPALEAVGAKLHRNLMAHAVIGAIAVARSLGYWWRLCAETQARFRTAPPDAVVTVDFPGLNVRIARWARARGIHAVHVVAPQLWAHQPWRVLRWRRAIDRLVATFPFEAPLFRKSGIATSHVGHPLFEAPLPPPRTPQEWPGDGACTLELWPGSRRREIQHHAPMLVRAAARITSRMPQVRFVVRLADAQHEALFRSAAGSHDIPLHFATGPDDASPLLGALSCSGTATAQLAADLVPMTAFYRTTRVARVFAWMGITTPWFLLPNLIAGRELVREHLFTSPSAADAIADPFLELVASADAWRAMRSSLGVVRDRLEVSDVAARAARVILSKA